MSIIINPGSGPVDEVGEGWSNSYFTALKTAKEWLERMERDGLRDIELLDRVVDDGDGRWEFRFRHKVTGVVVTLATHGIDDLDAYTKRHIFMPRVYWNGSSSSEPDLDDWKAPGFYAVKTFAPVPS